VGRAGPQQEESSRVFCGVNSGGGGGMGGGLALVFLEFVAGGGMGFGFREVWLKRGF